MEPGRSRVERAARQKKGKADAAPSVSAPAPANLARAVPVDHPSAQACAQPRGGYALGFLVALGIHVAILFGIPQTREDYAPPEFGVEMATPGVEVTLVAALPAETTEEPAQAEETPQPEAETPPVPTPAPEPTPEPVPEPAPEPVPETPPETPAEMTVPVPTPQPTPAATPAQTPVSKAVEKPSPKEKLAKPAKPAVSHRTRTATTHTAASGDGSSAIPGTDATSANASRGTQSAQPGYLRNPHPAYPEEARKEGQQGVVQLRVAVDEHGQVTSVTVARSSGYPLLDERARSTVAERWRFKPARQGKVNIATEVIVPIRFTLGNR